MERDVDKEWRGKKSETSRDGERQQGMECGLQIGNEMSIGNLANNGACDRKKQKVGGGCKHRGV